jgi:hypothetical protein
MMIVDKFGLQDDIRSGIWAECALPATLHLTILIKKENIYSP